MLRIPPVGDDLLTATHQLETLAGTSKLPPFGVLKQFHTAGSAAIKVSVCRLCASSRQLTGTLNLELVCN